VKGRVSRETGRFPVRARRVDSAERREILALGTSKKAPPYGGAFLLGDVTKNLRYNATERMLGLIFICYTSIIRSIFSLNFNLGNYSQ